MDIAATLTKALTPQPTVRTAAYVGRLDAHLDSLADDAARVEFLEREESNWRNRYREWCACMDNDRPVPRSLEGATAFDFIVTLSDIGTRKARYQQQLVA